MSRAASVILVHGAWADGSSWAKVIPLLVAKSCRVTAVQLPLTTLGDDAETVARAIALEEGPIILVGHSYGGAVITEAGTDPKVAALVYIAAFAPDAGESAGSLGATVEPSPLASEVRPDAFGFIRQTEAGLRNCFAQDLTEAEQTLLYVAQAPTSVGSLGGNVSVPAWTSRPSWYLVATEDRAIQPELQRTMAKRAGATTIELYSSHVAMLSHPQEVADLIAAAAA